MPIHIDVESDTLYLRGIEKGIEKEREEGKQELVVNFWQKGIEPSMISNLLDLTLEQVERIISNCQSKQNNI